MLKFLDVNAHLPPTQAKILLEIRILVLHICISKKLARYCKSDIFLLACGKTGSHSVMLVSLIEDGHPSLSWFMGLRSVRNPWYASILRPLLRGLDVEGGREVVICRGEGDGGGDLQLLLKGRRRGGAEMRGYCCLFLHAVFLSWFTLKKVLVFLPFCGLLVHEYEGEPWRSGKAAAL
ncbi:uncharacterized protein LOC119296198 isoform X2 [Triticum dicoccoides]|uniref:uncharacterized protein LOC119296198 isoform X2 n=1 Tax=Triticum dicoccoides TaxID=85692 RepID=UPI000E78FED1|nr:uncharacterized protein LOC119296198 isoform X2 [Triticum dicoccoides]